MDRASQAERRPGRALGHTAKEFKLRASPSLPLLPFYLPTYTVVGPVNLHGTSLRAARHGAVGREGPRGGGGRNHLPSPNPGCAQAPAARVECGAPSSLRGDPKPSRHSSVPQKKFGRRFILCFLSSLRSAVARSWCVSSWFRIKNTHHSLTHISRPYSSKYWV